MTNISISTSGTGLNFENDYDDACRIEGNETVTFYLGETFSIPSQLFGRSDGDRYRRGRSMEAPSPEPRIIPAQPLGDRVLRVDQVGRDLRLDRVRPPDALPESARSGMISNMTDHPAADA